MGSTIVRIQAAVTVQFFFLVDSNLMDSLPTRLASLSVDYMPAHFFVRFHPPSLG